MDGESQMAPTAGTAPTDLFRSIPRRDTDLATTDFIFFRTDTAGLIIYLAQSINAVSRAVVGEETGRVGGTKILPWKKVDGGTEKRRCVSRDGDFSRVGRAVDSDAAQRRTYGPPFRLVTPGNARTDPGVVALGRAGMARERERARGES